MLAETRKNEVKTQYFHHKHTHTRSGKKNESEIVTETTQEMRSCGRAENSSDHKTQPK